LEKHIDILIAIVIGAIIPIAGGMGGSSGYVANILMGSVVGLLIVIAIRLRKIENAIKKQTEEDEL
jgi:hypothetical protein